MKKTVILQIPEEVEFQCKATFALLSSSRRLPSVVLPDMLSDPPPYLPSHSQEFLFHSACCCHWIDNVINIILTTLHIVILIFILPCAWHHTFI